MENISGLGSILLGAMFVLAYLANLATRRGRRQWLYVGFSIAAVCYLIFFVIYSFYQDSALRNWLIPYNLFCGVGLVLPQLISRIVVRQNIKHPVVFVQDNKLPLTALTVVMIASVYMLGVATLSPTQASQIDHKPIYDEFYISSSFSYLLFSIPFIILLFEMLIERTAFCENGLYQYGLLSEWADFKAYSWLQDKMYVDLELQPFIDKKIKIKLLIEPVKSLFNKPIQFLIPFNEKNAIEEFLSQRIKVQ
jgi:hypothetical protein